MPQPLPVLVGVALLLRVGPGERLVTAFHHPKAGPVVALGRQRELDQQELPAAGTPPWFSFQWNENRVGGSTTSTVDGPALVPEPHVAMRARFDHQVHPVGEPLRYLLGLGDRAPHHLDWRLDQHVPVDQQAWHQHALPFRSSSAVTDRSHPVSATNGST